MTIIELNERIVANPEFRKLEEIGGHKVYHLEGNALIHTLNVYEHAVLKFGLGHWMTTVALLHDIGKIYTSIRHGDNDWEYPDHSTCGGFRGILCKFVPEDHEMFKVFQWYITNHIKPLYWKKKGKIDYTNPYNELCRLDYLRDLAICDIKGSKVDETNVSLVADQELLVEYLEELTFTI